MKKTKKTKKKTFSIRVKAIFHSRVCSIVFFFLNYISLLWFVMSTTFANYTIFSFLPSNLFFGGFFVHGY